MDPFLLPVFIPIGPSIDITWWVILSQFVLAVTCFLVGLVVGWHLSEDIALFTPEHLRVVVALAVTTIWVISIIADILIANYTTSVLLYGLMGGVAGYLFSDQGFTINIGS